MKRALLFAPYFLPRRRVGAMRPFRFVIHLREMGWEPTVLTIETRGQHLTEKEARLLEGIEIVSLRPPFDRSASAESQLRLAAAQPAAGPARPARKDFAFVDRHFPVDTWWLLFLMKYRTIVETVARVRPDVIWSTGDPWSSLVVTERLVRQLGTPWVADFRDPWTLCRVRTHGRSAPARAVDRHYERRILETADVVLFQAKRTEEKYRQHYADLDFRSTTIYNSYDPDVFSDPVDLEGATPRAVAPGPHLDVGFFGRFRALSPASVVADVLALARRRHGAAAERIRVHAFGTLSDADAAYAASKGVLTQFAAQPAAPLEDALSVLRRFDLLLLSTDPRRDEIIPAKLFEYLAAARPILSLSRNPEVGEILAQTGAGVQPGLDAPERTADLLVACVKAKDEHRPLPLPFDLRPDEVRRFEARATTRELADLFASISIERSKGH